MWVSWTPTALRKHSWTPWRKPEVMASFGRVGADFDYLLRHAKELLDVLDEELAELDPQKHADLLAAAPLLRHKLERLRDELRGGTAN